jgi:hypothetical protein
VITAQASALPSAPFAQATRTQLYFHRACVRQALPCRPRPPAPTAWASAVELRLHRQPEACGGRDTTGVSGLRPACGYKCSPRLAALLEMLHLRCRRGPMQRREVVTDDDARRWHRPDLVASGGSRWWSREGQRREGAREWCCGAVRTSKQSPQALVAHDLAYVLTAQEEPLVAGAGHLQVAGLPLL